MEKQRRDAVEDDAKQMEKLAHKRSLLMKKVRAVCCYASLCAAALKFIGRHRKDCPTTKTHMVKTWHPSFIETHFPFALLLRQYKEYLEFSNLMTCFICQQKEECAKKIRELGSLPADAFDKHQKTPVKTVC